MTTRRGNAVRPSRTDLVEGEEAVNRADYGWQRPHRAGVPPVCSVAHASKSAWSSELTFKYETVQLLPRAGVPLMVLQLVRWSTKYAARGGRSQLTTRPLR